MKTPQVKLVAELGESAFQVEGGARCVIVSPDGKHVLSIGEGAQIWDLETGARVADITTEDRPYALAISPDGKRVLLGNENLVRVIALGAKPKVIAKPTPKQKGLVTCGAFAPDGGFLFGDKRTPRRFDAKGKELPALSAHSGDVDTIAVSPDGKFVITGGKDAKLHDVTGKKPVVVFAWDDHTNRSGFTADGKRVWTSGYFVTTLRDVATGETVWRSDRADGAGDATIDGTRFARLGDDKLEIFEASKKKTPLVAIPGDWRTCAFTPDGSKIVVASEELGIAVYEVATGRRLLPSATGTTGEIATLAVAAKLPHAVYSAGADGSIMLWDVEAGAAIERIGAAKGAVDEIACSADGNTILVASIHEKLVAWTVRGASHKSFSSATAHGQSVAISPNGKRVAGFVYQPRALEVYELASRKRLASVRDGRSYGSAEVAFIDDDTVVAITTGGGVKAMTAKGKPVYGLGTESACTLCITGKTLVIGYQGGEIELHGTATGEPSATLRAKGKWIYRVRAIDDDRVAVLESDTRNTSAIAIWSIGKKRLVSRTTFPGDAKALAVSPDGTRLYVGTAAGKLLVYAT